MSQGPRPFRQRDLTRAIKGAIAAGMVPISATIDRSGAIKLGFGTANPGEMPLEDTWDKALGLCHDVRTGRPATNGATGT